MLTGPALARMLIAVVAMGAALAACDGALSTSESSEPPAAPGEAVVLEVIDGDTVAVLIDDEREKVRLIGIDTPEIAHPPEPAECFGPEAAAYVATVIPPGTRVILERDVEARDRYGRLLAYVHRVDDDLHVNEVLVERGYATKLHIRPNSTFADHFAALEAQARRDGIGLWEACGAADDR